MSEYIPPQRDPIFRELDDIKEGIKELSRKVDRQGEERDRFVTKEEFKASTLLLVTKEEFRPFRAFGYLAAGAVALSFIWGIIALVAHVPPGIGGLK